MPPPTDANRVKERTAVISLLTDGLQLIPSVIVAVLANSMTLYTDIMGDLNVLFTNFMLWLILRRMRRGMGVHYDYGTGKVENLVTVIGACVLILSLGYVVYTAVARLFSPVQLQTEATLLGALVMSFAAVLYGFLWFRNYRISQIHPSPIADLQWRVPMSNALISVALLLVLGAMVIFRRSAWSIYIDPVVSLIMSAFILCTFFGVIKTSFFDLLDRTLEERHQMTITRELAQFFEEYRHFHGVRSRRTGGRIFIEIFLEFDPQRSVGEIQAVAARLRQSIQEKIPHSAVSIALADGPPH